MNFNELLIQAKSQHSPAVTELLRMYQPLLLKEAVVDGVLDEDLYQELRLVLLRCIQRFCV